VGMPEGLYPIGLATLYCATSPKSNSVCGIFDAMKEVEEGGSTTVPLHLSTNPMNRNKDDKNYKYPHDYPDHYVKQQYLPDELVGKQFYQPSNVGFEAKIKAWIEGIRGNGESEAEAE
jgi:putative ATPase